jgi:hypothetical protein
MVWRKQFDWAAIQAAIDAGDGFTRCRQLFGIAHATWKKALDRGDLRIDTEGRPYADARKRFDWAEIQAFYDRRKLDSEVPETLRLFGEFVAQGTSEGEGPGA